MKRKRILILLLILLCIVNISCKRIIKDDKPKFIIDLPDTSNKKYPNYYYETIKKKTEQLMFNKLWMATDSFEIRLWAKVEVTNGGHVYVIKKINNQWVCLHYFFIENHDYWSNLNSYINNLTIDTFWVKKLQPKSNWNNFFNQIEKENIYKLPSQGDIKGWESIVEDGITYGVEIGTKNKYKLYYYNCPDVYSEKYIECKQMTNILEIFDKEFGIHFNFNDGYKCSYK